VLTVAQARERILARIRALESEDLPLLASRDRVLAEEIRAVRDVPPFPNSAMDGYAVQAADVGQASAERPVWLRLVGEVRAGEVPPAPVAPSTALRIMTGAAIPEGSDAVVRIEDTAERDGQVEVRAAVPKGMSVRAAGSDLRRGEVVATAGRLITPGLIGVLASAGRPTVRCIRQPRVAILTTGDELRDAGEALGPAEITNTNRYSLGAALQEAGAAVLDVGVARDDREELAAKLESAGKADLVVTTGGVSMGAYDLVRSLLEARDAVDFWQVALRPGKPLLFGTVHGVPLIGLPGNPVSALVGFELFVRPAVRKMQGREDLERPRVAALTEDRLHGLPTLQQYLRGVARYSDGRVLVRLTGDQGSHVLRSMADANCLMAVPPMEGDIEPGQAVDLIPLAPIA
jgi:molybdopterin molybdotransferase